MLMEMIAACVLSFAVTAVLGRWVILPALRRLKAGQEIRDVGPKWHASKAGTPTMGGLMFIAGIAAAILIPGNPACPFLFVILCSFPQRLFVSRFIILRIQSPMYTLSSLTRNFPFQYQNPPAKPP